MNVVETDSHTLPQRSDVPLVTATVRVDLSAEYDDDHHDRCQVFALDRVPNGARVVVWIGDRTWLWDSTARELNRQAQRLLVEVAGSPRADLRRWLEAVRSGSVGVIA